MELVCVCSGCFGGFAPSEITVVPRYDEVMEMVVTAHICPGCVDRVLDETEKYLRTARSGAAYAPGYGLKYNDVIEQFVGFLLRNDRFRQAIEVRYAPSLDEGIERVRRLLRDLRENKQSIQLPELS